MSLDHEDFERRIEFDPNGDSAGFFKQIPARAGVCLLSDGVDRAVQLLGTGNLLENLRGKLGDEQLADSGRRIDYRAVVRRIAFSRVDSAFERDVRFLQSARRALPDRYRALMKLDRPWYIHVDPNEAFPRYARSQGLGRQGEWFGPLRDRSGAGRLIERVQDWFDLCRYDSVLVQAPHETAYAYKEMGKCPAPCDGSISMEQYHRMIQWSVEMLHDSGEMLNDLDARMRAAAEARRFELAGRIKKLADEMRALKDGAYHHVRPMSRFYYLSLQRGPRTGTGKCFLIGPGWVEMLAGWTGAAGDCSDVIHWARQRARAQEVDFSDQGCEWIGVVAGHLLSGKSRSGIFLPLDEAEDAMVARGLKDLWRRRGRTAKDGAGSTEQQRVAQKQTATQKDDPMADEADDIAIEL